MSGNHPILVALCLATVHYGGMRMVRWIGDKQALVIDDGPVIKPSTPGSFNCNLGECADVLIGDLKTALEAAGNSLGFAPTDFGVWWTSPDNRLPSRMRTNVREELESELELLSLNGEDELEHVVSASYPGVDTYDGAVAIIGELLQAHGVELRWTKHYPSQSDQALECALSVRQDWKVAQVAALGHLVRVMLSDSNLSPSTPFGAYSLVLTGNAIGLLGQAESQWLEVKQQAYAFANEIQKHEYAVDLASIANSETGGLLLLGLRTERDASGRDIISEVCGCRPGTLNVQTYAQIAKQRIVPDIDGLGIRLADWEGRHLLAIHIPAQEDYLKPFIVRGGVLSNGRISAASVTIPRRVSDGRWNMSAEAVHSLLVAARVALQAGTRAAPDEQEGQPLLRGGSGA